MSQAAVDVNQHGERRLVMTRPDDWHVHLRDGAMLRRVVPDTARRFARAIVNAKPGAARDHHGKRPGLSRANPVRRACGHWVRPIDDAVPDRQHATIGDRRRQRQRFGACDEVVSRRRHHEFGIGCQRHRALRPRAGRHGSTRPATAGAWRSDRSGGGRVRPRARLHRASFGSTAGALPALARGAGTHHYPGSGGIRQDAIVPFHAGDAMAWQLVTAP